MAEVGAVDETTHTLYATDPPSGTVAVINTATCNTNDTTGCAQHPPISRLARPRTRRSLNPATQTLYVAYGTAATGSPS